MRKVPRVLGLVIASLIAAVYFLIVIGGLFDPEATPPGVEGIGMAVLALLTAASVIVAWLRPQLGGWLVLGSGTAFTIFGLVTAGQNRWMPVVAAGGPLILGGLLMLWGLRLERKD